ncbi:MAG: hypothetical protein WCG22_01260 [Lentisphaerota bacterium]
MATENTTRRAEPLTHPVRPLRRSASANQSHACELERLRRMSIQERILAALSIDTRYSWLKPAAKDT